MSGEGRGHGSPSHEVEPEPSPADTATSLFTVAELAALAAVVAAGAERDEALLVLIRCRWAAPRAIAELREQQLRVEAAIQTAGLPSPRGEPAGRRASAGGAGGCSRAIAPEPPPLPPAAVDAGYVVLRTPSPTRTRRGWHQCDWGTLMARLRIPRADWPHHKAGYYVRLYRSREEAEMHWTRQGLLLPIPVNP